VEGSSPGESLRSLPQGKHPFDKLRAGSFDKLRAGSFDKLRAGSSGGTGVLVLYNVP
jgi:hypothetical protein